MKSAREIILAIVGSSPKITIDAVNAKGDVAFHVLTKECSLEPNDFMNPITEAVFFVNFVGEWFVRNNIQKFSVILTGLCQDPSLYEKLILGPGGRHKDFGMVIDLSWSIMTFQMHLSLVQEIVTEFDRRIDNEIVGPSLFDTFDQSKPDAPEGDGPQEPEEEDE